MNTEKIEKEKIHSSSLEYLNFKTIKHFGIPRYLSPLIAFHNIQNIIALGTIDGKIKM
jgi:hypothetical protein